MGAVPLLHGLNLSNQQIAGELGLDNSDTQAMTEQLRRGLAAKAPAVALQGEVEIDEVVRRVGAIRECIGKNQTVLG